MSPGDKYDEDYFLHGVETGKSNYTNYRWLGAVTLEYATYLRRHLNLQRKETVLDYGCARGYLVKALRMAGITAFGVDISKWAIENCDPDVVKIVSNDISTLMPVDWVHCKDVIEHIEVGELYRLLPNLFEAASNGCLFIVPLTNRSGKFLYPNDELDPTHVNRHTLEGWIDILNECRKVAEGESVIDSRFTVSGSYHMHGLKPASSEYPRSTGFLMVKRF